MSRMEHARACGFFHALRYNGAPPVLSLRTRIDAWLCRYPFEGKTARRYAGVERPGFGDLDDRLIERWQSDLGRAATVLDVGAGPGTWATRLAAAYPHLRVIALEPSRAFLGAARGALGVRARAEALPLARGSVDVALCLSSIRHVADRRAALGELRRVVADTGVLYIVELDPAASARRIEQHIQGMRSWLSRLLFGPFVKVAPPARAIADIAAQAGWRCASIEPDPVQPVYIIRLTQ